MNLQLNKNFFPIHYSFNFRQSGEFIVSLFFNDSTYTHMSSFSIFVQSKKKERKKEIAHMRNKCSLFSLIRIFPRLICSSSSCFSENDHCHYYSNRTMNRDE